jgi:hypothetical protein
MLIDHDFDWDPDLEDSPRPEADPASGNGAASDPALRRPGPGQVWPTEQIVIIERLRGFPRSTLILALVALALLAAPRIPRTPDPDAALKTDHPKSQPDRDVPAQGDPPTGPINDRNARP